MDAFEYDPPVNDPAHYDEGDEWTAQAQTEQELAELAEYEAWVTAMELEAEAQEHEYQRYLDEQAAAEYYADAYLAQFDDDPSPYDGNYSEM